MSTIHPRTKATLDELGSIEWFSNVGTDFGITIPEKVTRLRTWNDAVEKCASVDWENLTLEAQEQYRKRLAVQSNSSFLNWNDVVDMLKVITVPLVDRKTEFVIAKYSLPQVFKDTVQWDILGVCLEAEFSDILAPGFYASNAFWYLKGHFPCGWDGVFPEGKLIVF